MPILRDIPIHLDVEKVLKAQGPRQPRQRGQGPRRRKGKQGTAMGQSIQQAIDLAGPLYAPAIVYEELAVQSLDGEQVTLVPPGGRAATLRVGPHADLLAPASRVLVAVYTLGPALEQQVERLNQAGEVLTAYWLDSVGVMALGQAGDTLRCIAEEQAAGRGWGVGAALSPGSLAGWPLHGQRELCALLPLSEIGVRLNERYVLEPHKSASTLIGMGPGYDAHKVGSVCHLCALADSCWRRH